MFPERTFAKTQSPNRLPPQVNFRDLLSTQAISYLKLSAFALTSNVFGIQLGNPFSSSNKPQSLFERYAADAKSMQYLMRAQVLLKPLIDHPEDEQLREQTNQQISEWFDQDKAADRFLGSNVGGTTHSVLQVLRRELETKKALESQPSHPLMPVKEKPGMFARFKPKRSPSPSRKEQPQPGFAQLSEPDDLGFLGPSIHTVHLSRQELYRSDIFTKILSLCPNLKIVQIPPSMKSHLRGDKLDMLAKRSISLEVRRDRDGTQYEERRFSPVGGDYTGKKAKYLEALTNPQKRRLVELLDKYEFHEVEVARMYFDVGPNKRPVVTEIAEELGISFSYAERKLNVFLTIMGYPTKNKRAHNDGVNLIKRINRYEKAEKGIKEREELRRSYYVGNQFAPINLSPNR